MLVWTLWVFFTLLRGRLGMSMINYSLSGDKAVDIYIDQICAEGCRRVSEIIVLLDSGEILPGCTLDRRQYTLLLHELKNIMAIYDSSGNCGVS